MGTVGRGLSHYDPDCGRDIWEGSFRPQTNWFGGLKDRPPIRTIGESCTHGRSLHQGIKGTFGSVHGIGPLVSLLLRLPILFPLLLVGLVPSLLLLPLRL